MSGYNSCIVPPTRWQRIKMRLLGWTGLYTWEPRYRIDPSRLDHIDLNYWGKQ
jgi:hypothetical protein